MNNIVLSGVLRDVQYSHEINGVAYNKANLIVPHGDEDDIIAIRFKRTKHQYRDGQQVDITGNIRSYSEKGADGHNHVQVYVFTYFDVPEDISNNSVMIDGRICKKEKSRKTKNGDSSIHFILANNIYTDYANKKINSYIPCTAFGKLAKKINKMHISDVVTIKGKLRSRIYEKHLPKGEIEFRVAHEVVIDKLEIDGEEV